MKIDSGTLPGEQKNHVFFQKAVLASQTLRISVTDECNYRCLYCYREGEETNGHKHGDQDLILRVAKVAQKFGVNRVKLTGGEPLLYPQLASLLNKLRNVISFIDIGTNGSMLDRYVDFFHATSIDALTISLDTINPNTFATLSREKSSSLKKVISNIENFAKLSVPIKINCVVTELNELDIPDLVKFCEERCLNLRLIEPNNFSWTKTTSNKEPFFKIKTKLLSQSTRVVQSSYLPSTYLQLANGGEVSLLECMCNGKYCDLCGRYMYLRFSINKRFKPCLFRTDTEIGIKNGDDSEISSALSTAIAFMGIGPNDHRFDEFLKIYHKCDE